MSALPLLAPLVEEFVAFLGVAPDTRTDTSARWSDVAGFPIALTLRWSAARPDRVEMVTHYRDDPHGADVQIMATTQPVLALHVRAPEVVLRGLARCEVTP